MIKTQLTILIILANVLILSAQKRSLKKQSTQEVYLKQGNQKQDIFIHQKKLKNPLLINKNLKKAIHNPFGEEAKYRQKNAAVNYNLKGEVLSQKGDVVKWKASKLPTVQNGGGPLLCGTKSPYIPVSSGSKAPCAPLVACDIPANRDASIPTGATPIKEFQVRWSVIDNGGTNINMTRVNDLMTELNADFLASRIQFCLGSVNFVTDATHYNINRGAGEEVTLKTVYGTNFGNVLNVYVVNNITNPSAGGFARFPYSSSGGYGLLGGVVLAKNSANVGSHILSHEVGHTFGLYHTFHGVSEVTPCTDCYEEVLDVTGAPVDGDTDGDRCSDTNPHPQNSFICGDAGVDACTGLSFNNSPVDNHMSYSFCSSQFTSQQAGRMHCMIDSYLTQWVSNGTIACGALAPVADFVATPLIWAAPANVSYTNLTAGKTTVTNWLWEFDVTTIGGVSPATSALEIPPTVTYSTPGLYTVRLTATNANGTHIETKVSYIEILAPTGDCDTLDFQWTTPVSTLNAYTVGAGDYLTGIPAISLAGPGNGAIFIERFPTPTPGTTTVGAVRLGLFGYSNTSGSMIVQVLIFDDLGGFPNVLIGGAVVPESILNTASSGVSEIWMPIQETPAITTANFHIALSIVPGSVSDQLILLSSAVGEGEADASNHVITTALGGIANYQTTYGFDFDLNLIPMLGGYKPFPLLVSYTENTVCDTTHILLQDTILYSNPNSVLFTFSDGSTYTDIVDPKFVSKAYPDSGPETVTFSASNSCGRADTATYTFDYNFLETPDAGFIKTPALDTICKDSVVDFTATPSGFFDYTWDFGDATVVSSGALDTISYIYPTVGLYYTQLTLTGGHYSPMDTIFIEQFELGIPGTFTLINNDGLTPDPSVAAINNAWVNLDIDGSGDGEAVSTSFYNPTGTADDWLITPAIMLNANSSLYWDAQSFNASFADGYQVRISTTTPTIPGFMAHSVLLDVAAENTIRKSRYINLASAGFKNQNVYIAFVNNSTNKFILSIDDIVVGSSRAGCIATEQKFDFVNVIDCSLLSIGNLTFDAKLINNTVELTWSTENKSSTESFKLERSKDGKSFEQFNTQDAAGYSTDILNYVGYDYSPYNGRSYYRLKQVDEGSFTYSELREIYVGNLEMVKLYPNPAEGLINLEFHSQQQGTLQMTIINAMGQQVANKTFTLQAGKSTIGYDVSDLSSGTYLVKLTTSNGEFITKEFLVR